MFNGFQNFDRAFEDMSQQMAQMDRQMSQQFNSILGNDFFGANSGGNAGVSDMRSLMRIPDLSSMSTNGGSKSFVSSFSSVTKRGADGKPQTVQYTSSSRKAALPGMEEVSETQRNYRDSSGFEKSGVARTVGNRGRNVVRERDPSGEERTSDNLLGITDGAAFDQEWQRAGRRLAGAPSLGHNQMRGRLDGGAGMNRLDAPAMNRPTSQYPASLQDRRVPRHGRIESERRRLNP
mmetsp:Transcript_20029/g.27731  ORF Transcript_20029/g.27731 Transcript_20029/m.27731 type:complete len:235 (+) Transcript_20029:240-944(+)|eukprot:CAMPEP_0196582156 /NCGR_PEP_ID=MMETSP1081-20130531/37709_1 /TAXON_ID=36882 /ORGANISM="Pyramimonas amylifera, Strain CCMP720" /LENGTH=234 /DNA_ID=CAMNT_0041902643 /DNA_START=240 /DNA_END=944 /DNA_ORIENTATION=+